MTRLQKAQKDLQAITAKMGAALDAKASKPEDWTPENETELVALRASLASAKQAKVDAEEIENAERSMPAKSSQPADGSLRVVGGGTPNSDRDPAKGFASHRDFLVAVRENATARTVAQIQDERLKPLMAEADAQGGAFLLPLAFAPRAAVGSDEQNASQDVYGGFSVREQMVPGMLTVDPEADPTVGRVQNVPMEAPSVKILARTDKNHTSSVSGGFSVARRAEMATISSSRQSIERITLNAAMLAGLAFETEELMQDSMLSFAAIIAAGFRSEFPHKKFSEKLRGTGGDQYLGVLTALAASSLGPTISIAKETGQAADTINAQNVIKMRARCWGYGNAIWLANHDTYPQLAGLSIAVGTGGALVYQQSVREDRPDLLLGRPIFYSEYPSTLGDQGDLVLGNWSQYLEGVYQPLQSASSIHVRFDTLETAFRFYERNAGAPWWRTALTPHKGSNTLSPFVVLDARA